MTSKARIATQIRLPEYLYDWLKEESERTGLSINDVLLASITQYRERNLTNYQKAFCEGVYALANAFDDDITLKEAIKKLLEKVETKESKNQ